MIPQKGIIQLQDKIYPLLLIVLLLVTIFLFIMQVRNEKNISNKSIFKIESFVLLKNDEIFTIILSGIFLMPIYIFTLDDELSVAQYIGITFSMLILMYIFKFMIKFFLRK